MRLLFLSFLPAILLAQAVTSTLSSVDDERATAQLPQAQVGLSGVVVRQFNDEHSAIIANVKVASYDPATKTALLDLATYDGLKQNSLPKGVWTPKKGDQVRIAPDYARALLIAPDAIVYDRITSAFKSIGWVHPDRYAAYLSATGHPSPTQEDFNGFCTDNAVGLLYIYLEHSLFTLDCKTLSLLQIANAPVVYKSIERPFYNRVDTIREGWWGEGSNEMERYAPYYLELIEAYNEGSQMLASYHADASKSSFKRDMPVETVEESSWFGGFFDFVGDFDIGLERDYEEALEQEAEAEAAEKKE